MPSSSMKLLLQVQFLFHGNDARNAISSLEVYFKFRQSRQMQLPIDGLELSFLFWVSEQVSHMHKGLPVFLALGDGFWSCELLLWIFHLLLPVSGDIPMFVFASSFTWGSRVMTNSKIFERHYHHVDPATDLPFLGPINIPADAMKILQNLHQHHRL